MQHFNRLITLTAAIFAVTASGFAFGQSSDTANFDVTATVQEVCSITAGNTLEFGNYDPVAATAVTGTTTVDVTCSNGMTGTEVGLAYSGEMSDGGTATLTYGLFQDTEHSTPWADTDSTDRQDVGADGTSQTMTVYGQIDADQNTATTGTYTENVTATVYW